MTSQYVVTVETTGDHNKETLKSLKPLGLVDQLVRDDDTGILYFEWKPDAEPDGDDGSTGASTWEAAKASAAHVRSAVGAYLTVVECRIELHDDDDHRSKSARKRRSS